MKPCSFKKQPDVIYLNKLPLSNKGIGVISGSVKVKNDIKTSANLCLFDRQSLKPIQYTFVKQDGSYSFVGIPMGVHYFVVSFDTELKYNSVIFDYIFPS